MLGEKQSPDHRGRSVPVSCAREGCTRPRVDNTPDRAWCSVLCAGLVKQRRSILTRLHRHEQRALAGKPHCVDALVAELEQVELLVAQTDRLFAMRAERLGRS